MNDSRLQLKVGLFVAIGLGLIALLVLNFTRGVTLFKSTYSLRVNMPTTAGLKPSADVMISGVQVGKVTGLTLNRDSQSVMVTLQILSQYRIPTNSVFRIEALGFLGDQYVEVSPPRVIPTNADQFLTNDALVQGQAPFNILETVRSVSDLLDEAKTTLGHLDQAMTNINRTVLSDRTLSSLSLSVSNLKSVTEIAVNAAHGAADLIQTNSGPLTAAVTNIETFSVRLDTIANELEGVVATNKPEIARAVQNLRDASGTFQQIASDLQAGKGPVGELLKDEAMKAQLVSAVSNANQLASNLSSFSSNLNQRGLWSMLWKPKHPTAP